MKIVIVGDGKVGSALTEQLSKEGHDIVVIDQNRNVLQEAEKSLDVNVVHGNGATLKILKMANAGSSDLVIAATAGDETNILCCLMARKLGCPHTIARVRDPDYYSQLSVYKDDLGMSMMINPERSAANEIYRLLQFPSFLKRDSFAKGRVEIVELELKSDSVLAGAKLSELYQLVNVKVLVCAVERKGEVHIPDGRFILAPGDKLSVTASSADLTRLIRNLGLEKRKVRDCIIVGGSRTAFYLAEKLIGSGVSVKIIETEEERCRSLADSLPRATIINADGSDRNVLDSEGFPETDAVVTLTNIDEENLMISMYANYLGINKVITKINRTEFGEVLSNTGIDCIISPKALCCNEIVRYVRAMGNKKGESMLTLHRIVDDRVEALEFSAGADLPQLGKKLSEIKLKPNTLLSCIHRNGRIIIPGGSDTIEPNDSVIVVARADRVINDLREIFVND